MRITAITILLFLNYWGLTQNIDFGLSLGGSNYSGDLTENPAISVMQTHPCLGIHGRTELDPLFSIKLQYMYLKISGDDKFSKRQGNRNRQLNFESNIHEINFTGQMQFLNLWSENTKKLNPYLQLGVSAFSFNPMTQYQGELVSLQALGTEGQGMVDYNSKYKLINFAWLMGLGIKYFLNSRYSLTLDALMRKTNTDYLDDASTDYVSYEVLLKNQGKIAADLGNKIFADTGTKRASPTDKDWYQSIVLTISYHFKSQHSVPISSRKKTKIHCPSF